MDSNLAIAHVADAATAWFDEKRREYTQSREDQAELEKKSRSDGAESDQESDARLGSRMPDSEASPTRSPKGSKKDSLSPKNSKESKKSKSPRVQQDRPEPTYIAIVPNEDSLELQEV